MVVGCLLPQGALSREVMRQARGLGTFHRLALCQDYCTVLSELLPKTQGRGKRGMAQYVQLRRARELARGALARLRAREVDQN